jgi:hypothetical protein
MNAMNNWRIPMQKTFRALIIDPERCTIREIQTPCALDDCKRLVGGDGLDSFRIFEHAESCDHALIYGRGLADGAPIHAFKFGIRRDPVAGRCLIIGADKQLRDHRDAAMSLFFLREIVTWLGLIKPEVTWVAEEHGDRAVVTYSRCRREIT